jgi:hypothetical protein
VALVVTGGFVVGWRGVRAFEVGVNLELIGAYGGTLNLRWGDVLADPIGDLVEGAEFEDITLAENELGRAELVGGLLGHASEAEFSSQFLLLSGKSGFLGEVDRADSGPGMWLLMDRRAACEEKDNWSPRQGSDPHASTFRIEYQSLIAGVGVASKLILGSVVSPKGTDVLQSIDLKCFSGGPER